MKFVMFGRPDAEVPGVLTPRGIVPISQLLVRWGLPPHTIVPLLSIWTYVKQDFTDDVERETVTIDPDSVRLGAPLPRPKNVFGVGMNYPSPTRAPGRGPVQFSKAVSYLLAPNEDIVRPHGSEQLDYEAELAIVIGRGGRNIRPDQAWKHIAGYTLTNDVTAPDLMDPSQIIGKASDTFLPVGPCVVTTDELPDVVDLVMRTTVNGEIRQESKIGNMFLDPSSIVELFSSRITLQPGDLILTGTPYGLAGHQTPVKWLQEGDRVEISITEIGTLSNRVGAPEAARP